MFFLIFADFAIAACKSERNFQLAWLKKMAGTANGPASHLHYRLPAWTGRFPRPGRKGRGDLLPV